MSVELEFRQQIRERNAEKDAGGEGQAATHHHRLVRGKLLERPEEESDTQRAQDGE